MHHHYSLLLGLIPPWLVTHVDLNVENRLVEIDVQWPIDHQVECPDCHVGIDEKSFLKGHKYAFLMVDVDGARILDAVQDRTLAAAEQLWQKLSEEVRGGIDAVARDMWDAFITSTKNMLRKPKLCMTSSTSQNTWGSNQRSSQSRPTLGATETSPTTASLSCSTAGNLNFTLYRHKKAGRTKKVDFKKGPFRALFFGSFLPQKLKKKGT